MQINQMGLHIALVNEILAVSLHSVQMRIPRYFRPMHLVKFLDETNTHSFQGFYHHKVNFAETYLSKLQLNNGSDSLYTFLRKLSE